MREKPQTPLSPLLPRGMVQTQAQVLAHRRVAPDHYLLRLKAPLIARRAQPGQFIHLRCYGDSPQRDTRRSRVSLLGTVPLLRRPFSLLDVNLAAGTIEFIYKVVGFGTGVLTGIPTGAKVDLLGPLGRPFEIPLELKRAVLVGGGVGIPPLVLLAKGLVKACPVSSVRVSAFLGARTKEWVICAADFRRLGVPVLVATDDGSRGYRGSVVDCLKEFLRSTIHDRRSTVLYICGPTPMMAAAARLARREGFPAQVSLEERMGCAMGCCMGCVVEVTTEPVTSHSRFQRVCTEGPVFPAEAILWR